MQNRFLPGMVLLTVLCAFPAWTEPANFMVSDPFIWRDDAAKVYRLYLLSSAGEPAGAGVVTRSSTNLTEWSEPTSVLRVPAGAALAASVFGADNATMAAVAALMGGTLAATSQAAKTTTRALINTSPEPLSNVGASFAEDTAAVGAVWLALADPTLFALLLVVVVIVMWVVTWMLWRFLKAAIRKIKGWFGAQVPEAS